MQIGPLEIVIVLIIALLIFGGRFGGIGRNIGGRLRRTKDAAVEAGHGLRDGYEEEPASDSRVTRAARRSRKQVEAAATSIPDAARGAKEGFVEEGPSTSRVGRAAESAGRKTRSGADTVAGTAASAGLLLVNVTMASASGCGSTSMTRPCRCTPPGAPAM